MLKKLGVTIVVFFCGIILLTGCKKEPITIGFTANLTGTGSEIAVKGMYGAMFAVETINEAGGVNGREVILLIEDDGNSKETAMFADHQLLDQGAIGIVGHMMSGVAEQAIAFINAEEVVMVSPTISSSEFSNYNDYFYTLMPVSEVQSERIAEAILDNDCTSVGLLYQVENETFSKAITDDVIGALEDSRHQVAFTYGYSYVDDQSFKNAVDMVIAEGVDSLVIAGSAFDVAKYAQLLENNGLDLPIFTSTWSMSPDLIQIAGPTAEGIYTVNAFDFTDTSEAFEVFSKGYEVKFGEMPNFASAHAYEATMLLLAAIENSEDFKGKSIKASMDKIDNIEGLQGRIEIDDYGDAGRHVHLFQVQNGEFVKVD